MAERGQAQPGSGAIVVVRFIVRAHLAASRRELQVGRGARIQAEARQHRAARCCNADAGRRAGLS